MILLLVEGDAARKTLRHAGQSHDIGRPCKKILVGLFVPVHDPLNSAHQVRGLLDLIDHCRSGCSTGKAVRVPECCVQGCPVIQGHVARRSGGPNRFLGERGLTDLTGAGRKNHWEVLERIQDLIL